MGLNVKVLSSKVGYGQLGHDGALGYGAGDVGNRVCVPSGLFSATWTLSAHADSEVVIRTEEPIAVAGLLNASSLMFSQGTCEFWINDHWLGDLAHACDHTPWVEVPPGVHRLRATSTREHYGVHSVWGFRAIDPRPTRRVALCTVACYDRDRLKYDMRYFYLAAAQQGWLVHAFGAGERFNGLVGGKMTRLLGWLESLPTFYTHLVFADAGDSFVLGSESQVAERLRWPVVLSAEPPCWPEHTAKWERLLKDRALAQNGGVETGTLIPNSGLWGGERTAVIAALRQADDLRKARQRNEGPDWLRAAAYHHNDQHWWQAAFAERPEAIHLDTTSEIFCSMTYQHTDFVDPTIRHERDDAGRYRLRTRHDTTPLFLHFQGREGKDRVGPWYHWCYSQESA